MTYTLKNKIQKIHWDTLGRDATPEEVNRWIDFVMAGNPQPSEQYARIKTIKYQINGGKRDKKVIS